MMKNLVLVISSAVILGACTSEAKVIHLRTEKGQKETTKKRRKETREEGRKETGEEIGE